MPVTQKDIAQKVGVSQQLVGMVLNGKDRASEKTRRDIIELATELGYNGQSNREARVMAAKRRGGRIKNNMLAVLLPELFDEVDGYSGAVGYQEPFHMPLLYGIERQAGQHRVDIVLCIRADPLPTIISESRVDGIICVGSTHDTFRRSRTLELCRELSLPAVTLTVRNHGAHSLMPDDREGMRQAVAYLAGLGHRRIAYLGQVPESASAKERLSGYRDGMEQCGLQVEEDWIEATLKGIIPRLSRDGMKRLLARSRDFTAIVCYNDTIASGAVWCLEEAGLKVPDDISIVGFDDVSVQLGLRPALTSIAVDRQAMGERAVQLLLAQREPYDDIAEETTPLVHEVFPVKLVVRDSTAQPRTMDKGTAWQS